MTWRNVCFKADSRLIQEAYDTTLELHREIVALGLEGGISFVPGLQPIHAVTTQESLARGGNLFNLPQKFTSGPGAAFSAIPHDSIMFFFQADFSTPELLSAAAPLINAAVSRFEKRVEQLNAETPWRYMNYSDVSQDPLSSYGSEALTLLRHVSHRYDPEGVFQSRVPGGFKIPKA